MRVQPLERRGVPLVRFHEVPSQTVVFFACARSPCWRRLGSARGVRFQQRRPIAESRLPRDQLASFSDFERRTGYAAPEALTNILKRDDAVVMPSQTFEGFDVVG